MKSFYLLAFGVLALTAAALTAQSTDPRALLRQAATINGLAGDQAKPWHLKASYKVYSPAGEVKYEGAWEEFWAGPRHFRREMSGSNFNQIQWGTEQGLLQTGANRHAPWPLDVVRALLVRPLMADAESPETQVEMAARLEDGSRCVRVQAAPAPGLPFTFSLYCFDPDQNVLQIATANDSVLHASFLNPVELQGRILAGDVELTAHGKPLLSAHLASFETLAQVDEAQFTPPSDALPPPIDATPEPLPHEVAAAEIWATVPAATASALTDPEKNKVSLGEDVSKGFLLRKVAPVYPPIAKAAHIQGTVVLQATISKSGEIEELRVLSGPVQLLQGAVDAVKQWRYKPYLLYGEPVEVLTTVNVIFALGN